MAQAQVNEKKRNKSKRRSVYYAQQYMVTYSNKAKSLRRHIAHLKGVLDNTVNDDKRDRISRQIADCERALRDMPVKK